MPKEDEDVLTGHPAVAQAHVVPLPDDRMGEVGGVRGPRRGCRAGGGFCAERLARFKVQGHVLPITVPEIPTTPSGRPPTFLPAERAAELLGSTVIARVALVTGAARGIGGAVALRLAQDGHDVAVLDLDAGGCGGTVAAVEGTGRRALPVGADVTDEAAVTAAVERVAAELGPPTVLVNNAGVLRDSPLHRMELVDWRTVLDVHLTGAFLMNRAAQRRTVEAGWGRIVNLSSIAAVGDRGQAHYSSAKAGCTKTLALGWVDSGSRSAPSPHQLTRVLARELGPRRITGNAVAPGPFPSRMMAAILDRGGHPGRRRDLDDQLILLVRRGTLSYMTELTVSEARARLPEVLDRVAAGDEITITRHGVPAAVVLRPDAVRARRASHTIAGAREIGALLAAARERPLGPSAIPVARVEEMVETMRAERDRS